MKEKIYVFSFLSLMIVSLVACDPKENESSVSKKFTAKNINEIYIKTTGQIKNDFSLSSGEKGNDHKVKGHIGTGKGNDTKLTAQSMTGTIELKSNESVKQL